MTEQQQLTHNRHASLHKQLSKLDAREERLIDLAADGTLSRSKIHDRSNAIRLERARIQASLADSTAELALGAEVLRSCIDLATNPVSLYNQSADNARRQINRCFYDAFYLDDIPAAAQVVVTRDVLKPPFDEIREAATVFTQALENADRNGNGPDDADGTIHENRTPILADIFRASCSSKRVLVELTGLLSRSAIRTFLSNLNKQLVLMSSSHRSTNPSPSHTVWAVEQRLGAASVAELVAAYVAGTPTTQLMHTYHLGKGSVLRILHEHGVVMRRQPMPEAAIEQAVQLYRDGWSLAKIGSKFSVDSMTVRAALLKRGVVMRSANVQP